jgi:lipoprotein
MKKVFSYFLILLLFAVSCQEKTGIVETATRRTSALESVSPLEFSSIDELQNTICGIRDAESISKGTKAAFPMSGFLSYAETVMQEDGYDDRPNAICSEAFGSILNPDGEVIFGENMLKLCKYGILYAPKNKSSELKNIAEQQELTAHMTKASDFLFSVDTNTQNMIFRIDGYDGIYFLDAFNLVATDEDMEAIAPSTKAVVDGVTFVTDVTRKGLDLDGTYTIPNGGDQKNKFPSNNKIANDTKIYKENFAVYKESGVKTKTMKKKGLIWNKFDCNITSAITDLVIRESWSYDSSTTLGWVDINTTKYKGKSAVIATKLVSGLVNPAVSNATVIKDCAAAMEWGKQNGVSVSNVDGVRYIGTSDTKTAFTRIKDDVRSVYDAKCTIQFNLEPSGTLSADKSTKGDLVIYNQQYRLEMVTFYGFSEYNGDKRGSRMRYYRNLQ